MSDKLNDSSLQQSNAELRLRYIKFMQFLNGKPVQIRLCDKIDISGDFSAMQRSGQHFIVNNLKTPTSVIENGIIRSGDTVSVTISTDTASV